MVNALLALGIFSTLFILLWFASMLGRWFGKKHRAMGSKNLAVVKVAEGTVFALLGLLIAFCFSGAYNRFEDRKNRIIEDMNVVQTAYAQIDLLNPTNQINMRKIFIDYLDAKIELYHHITVFNDAIKHLKYFNKTKKDLWDYTMVSTKNNLNTTNSLLFITGINNLLDIAGTRLGTLKIHPPLLVFFLLTSLAMLSCFLIGYSLAEEKFYSPIFLFTYVFVISLTIYIIIDLEMPRAGLIRVDAFDNLLVETRDKLKIAAQLQTQTLNRSAPTHPL